MNFATPTFLFFLVCVVAIVFFTNSPKVRKAIVLIASYIFYASWNIPFIALILISTSIDYILSKRIALTERRSKRKLLLLTGIVVNVLILGIFKYFNFFVDTVNNSIGILFHHSHALHRLSILLPLGISFYTFEAISYLVDVYRGERPAESFYEYNFYIMYFPHLISGPIVRYRELSPQIREGLFLPSIVTVKKAFELIVLGLFFKLVLADSVSALVDPVFANVRAARVSDTYLSLFAFQAQIYFDLMGYTHIARGVSLLFNITLPVNFNHPWNATSLADFWRRWHITLSRWIGDYLFIPLGGSKAGGIKTAFTFLLTMTIVGSWHGAGWPFIIFGLYNGVILYVLHIAKPIRDQIKTLVAMHPVTDCAYTVATVALTYLSVTLSIVWFRSPDLITGVRIFRKLAQVPALHQEQISNVANTDFTFFGALAMVLFMCCSGPWVARLYNKVSLEMPYWFKVQVASSALVLCYIFAEAETKPFIYFQF